ncbi:MAG TPA: SDR family NAD(P)-dependent oxidoreductase, partial [Mycobacteriales bacterium]|nr:SDR family NAD(P)-dependent oxidoreductase [Mycobacteriales bacterium]
ALSGARIKADPNAPKAALSSVKGNFGHTKAAAGIAGLIKATLSVHNQVIPPATGHFDPHEALEDAALYVPSEAVAWPAEQPIRAGVSAMGFGGINTHIAIEQAPGVERHGELAPRITTVVNGRQDVELLLFDGADSDALRERLSAVTGLLPKLSLAELTDLAGQLAGELSGAPLRAAVVATNPEDAVGKIERLLEALEGGAPELSTADGVFLDQRTDAPKIAFLFPGQGAGQGGTGAIGRRFAAAKAIYDAADLPTGGDQTATEVAQPRIVAGSMATLDVLRSLGIDADAAVGHSLGELSALAWAGVLDAAAVQTLAKARGQVMANASEGGGAMAGLATTPERAKRLFGDDEVVIAGYNGPQQTVIAGNAEAVDRVCERAKAADVNATRVRVSHAFHSPLVAPAAEAFTAYLAETDFGRPERKVASTVTGDWLDPDADLGELLREQITLPVRFHEAAAKAVEGADLVVEVGPGRILSGLVKDIAPGRTVLAVDSESTSLSSLLAVVGAAFVLGSTVDTAALFADRIVRALPADGDFGFLASPCEAAPDLEAGLAASVAAADAAPADATDGESTGGGGGGADTLELLRKLAAERVELPLDAVSEDTHPLDDLHLSSITVGQIVNDVTREQGLPTLEMNTNFATVTLGELSELIDAQAGEGGEGGGSLGQTAEAAGVAQWVRPFSVEYLPAPEPAAPSDDAESGGTWQVFATDGHALAEPIKAGLTAAGLGDGILLCLDNVENPAQQATGLFLAAGQAAAAAEAGTRFVVVQGKFGASGLARTAFLESAGVVTTIVTLPDLAPSADDAVTEAVTRVVAEVGATKTFSESRYTADGTRTAPILRALLAPPEVSTDTPLGPDDVLLVTGGGKGITAECALVMAQDSGCKLALVGRDEASEDEELVENMGRMEAAGVVHQYERADVTDAEAVAAAVAAFEANLGPVTAVMHGAGRNVPGALSNLTDEDFDKTLAPKITGLLTVLDAVDEDKIKLLVTFGSIIGRAGLKGEAHYSTANDWMSELTVDFQERHPDAKALAMEWSVWSGAGMGEKLGVVEALVRDGITPVSLDNGLAVLRQLLADPSAGPILTIAGRMGGLPTLPLETSQELPLTRFVDRVVVHYPKVELITEVELSSGTDPYLSDHELDGDLLFPAVLGMEAMTQVAVAALDKTGPTALEDVEFLRPIVVRPGSTTTLRLAALVRDTESVAVVIRAEDTDFAADHFRATVRIPRSAVPDEDPQRDAVTLPSMPTDAVAGLYGDVLFQGTRFQRLQTYRRASARHAVAELTTATPAPWFAAYLPQDLLLADPGTRDAVMHSIQCCVPDATLLPQGIEKLYLAEPSDQEAEFVVMDARERSQDGDSYTYDVDVLDAESGRVVERWQGLTLRAVGVKEDTGNWAPVVLGSIVERALERVLGGSRAVVIETDPEGSNGTEGRRARTDVVAGRAVGAPVSVQHRPDGKPELGDAAISASHGGGLSMVVTGPGELGCDLETVEQRSEEDWAGLLGDSLLSVRDLVANKTGEDADTAATRVWTARECLSKIGSSTRVMAVERSEDGGWVVLTAGDASIATWVTTVAGLDTPVVIAVLVAATAISELAA